MHLPNKINILKFKNTQQILTNIYFHGIPSMNNCNHSLNQYSRPKIQEHGPSRRVTSQKALFSMALYRAP